MLNTLIQNAATIIFKQWMINCYLAYRPTATEQVLAYHDELGWEVYSYAKYDAERMGQEYVEQARNAGRMFDLRVPVEADFKVGKRYNEVH